MSAHPWVPPFKHSVRRPLVPPFDLLTASGAAALIVLRGGEGSAVWVLWYDDRLPAARRQRATFIPRCDDWYLLYRWWGYCLKGRVSACSQLHQAGREQADPP